MYKVCSVYEVEIKKKLLTLLNNIFIILFQYFLPSFIQSLHLPEYFIFLNKELLYIEFLTDN